MRLSLGKKVFFEFIPKIAFNNRVFTNVYGVNYRMITLPFLSITIDTSGGLRDLFVGLILNPDAAEEILTKRSANAIKMVDKDYAIYMESIAMLTTENERLLKENEELLRTLNNLSYSARNVVSVIESNMQE